MDTSATAVKSRVSISTAGKEFDKVTMIALSVVAISFGVFAFASIGGAIASVGLSGLAKSWFVAIGLI